jgi:hypothetical protein
VVVTADTATTPKPLEVNALESVKLFVTLVFICVCIAEVTPDKYPASVAVEAEAVMKPSPSETSNIESVVAASLVNAMAAAELTSALTITSAAIAITPVLEIVASPLAVTAVAKLELFPTIIFPLSRAVVKKLAADIGGMALIIPPALMVRKLSPVPSGKVPVIFTPLWRVTSWAIYPLILLVSTFFLFCVA